MIDCESSNVEIINKNKTETHETIKSETTKTNTDLENSPSSKDDLKSAQDEQNELLNKLYSNVNYAIVLAFFDKFNQHLDFKDITNYKNFESSLINKKTINRKLLDFHINLLKNLHVGKNVKKDKWEHYLTKYVSKFSIEDSLFIEQNSYLNCDIDLRISIIKNLLESQFDENLKFKQILIEQISDLNTLRSMPIGCDKDGVSYWYFMDKEFTIRLFTQNANDTNDKTWKLIAKELIELKDLIKKLNEEPSLVKLRNSKRYLANLEKERKLKEKQAKEVEESLKLNETITTSAVKIKQDDRQEEDGEEETEDIEIDVEEAKIKNDLYDDEIDEKSKKDEDSNHKTETESVSSVKSELKEEDKTNEDTSSNDTKPKSIKDEETTNNSNDKEIKEEVKGEPSIIEPLEENKKEIKTPIKQYPNDDSTLLLDDDIIQPIALRKSTRASARKAQEQIQQPLKTPTKSPAKKQVVPSAKKTNKKDEDNELDVLDDEDDVEEKNKKSKRKKTEDDQEFKLKISKTLIKEASNKSAPSSSKNKRKSKKKETDSEEEEYDDEDYVDFDSSCVKCSKVKRNQLLILCDGCDAAYHLVCLKIDEVPEGDWYCCLCQHDKLIRALEEKSFLIDNHLKEIELAKTKSISKRTNRIADIGANLDNLFSNKSTKKKRVSNTDNENNDPNEEDDDDDRSFSKKRQRRQPFEDVNHKPVSNFFSNTEPLGPRSCRMRNKTYTFEEYDRTLKEAMGEKTAEDEEEIHTTPNKTRSSKRVVKKSKEYEDDDTEYEENKDEDDDEENDDKKSHDSSDSEFKVKNKRKAKFSDSEEDDEDENDEKENSDEDFKPSKSRKSVAKKSKRKSKSKKKTKTRRNYYDDYDDENIENDDDDEEEEFSDYSDEEEDFKRAARKNKDLYSFERRSTRNRKCLKESYCELEEEDDDEEYGVKKSKKSKSIKKKKNSDDEEEYSDDISEEEIDKKVITARRSGRFRNNFRKYDDDYNLDDENDDDYDEKSLDKNHRNNDDNKPAEKSKSRIKKPWSDDDDSDEEKDEKNENEAESEEDIKKKTKSVIKKPWSKEEDTEEEEDEDDEAEDEEKEKETDYDENKMDSDKDEKVEKVQKPDQKPIESKKLEEKELNLKKEETNSKTIGHKLDLIYSSSSSYSSSPSSTRSNSPSLHKEPNAKPNESLSKETLVEKLNKVTSLIDDEVKKKENCDINLKTNEKKEKHSEISPIKKSSESDSVNKVSSSLDLFNSSLVQQPTITYSNSLTNIQSKPIQLVQPQQQQQQTTSFQLYNPNDFVQKQPIIASTTTQPLNTFANTNNSFTNIYSSSYPLYYYYQQQQQQQFNSSQVQAPLILQPTSQSTLPTQLLPSAQAQPQLTFLQPYASNTIVYNGQPQASNFAASAYSIQPVGNLFQPQLLGFNTNPNGASTMVQTNTNGISVNLAPLNPTASHHHQIQQ